MECVYLSSRWPRLNFAVISDEGCATRQRSNQLNYVLSAILLAGLLLNTLFGLWWADPVAGLVMGAIIAKEGVDGLQGRACADGCG